MWCVRSGSNLTAEGQRQRWATPVGVTGGSPGFRRGSAIGANDEVDDNGSPSTGSFSWGGSNRWLPSSPAAAGSGQIPVMRCSPCSRNGVERSVRRGEWNGVKKSSEGGLYLYKQEGSNGRQVYSICGGQ